MAASSTSPQLVSGRKSQRVYRALRSELESDRFAPGEQFHTISEICAEYKISSTTAVKCLDRLVEESLLLRRQGSGTYVSQRPEPVEMRSAASVLQCLDYVMPEDIGSRAGPEYLTDLLTRMQGHHAEGEIALRLNLLPARIQQPKQMEQWLTDRLNSGAKAFVFRWMPRVAQEIAAANGWPTCVHGRPDAGISLPFVDLDQRQLGTLVGQYLVEQDCQRVGVLMRAEWRPGDNVMVNGLMEQLGSRLAGIETSPPDDVDIDAAVHRLLAKDPAIDALVVRNHAGTWLPTHLHELSKSVKPMPVVCELKWHPLLTHVVPQDATISESLVGMLEQMLRGKTVEPVGTELRVKLVPPGSEVSKTPCWLLGGKGDLARQIA